MTVGLCYGRDPDIWFPKVDDAAGQAQAKAFCRECPLQLSCLIFALRMEGTRAASGRAGIYGGMTEEERARFTKRCGSSSAAIETAKIDALPE